MNAVFTGTLQAVDAAIEWGCRAVLYVTLSVVFVILTVNVGLRYLAGTSLAWASELPELMFPWMIMAGVVIAAQHGSHIAVVLVTQKLGAARRWVLAAGSLIVAALYGSLAWMAIPVAVIAHDEKTPILQLPGSLSVGCLAGGFALLAVVTLCRLPRLFEAEPAEQAEAHAAEAAAHGA